jgi:hypothetical protein
MGAMLTPRKLALDKGEPKARTDYEDRFERSRLAGSGKTIVHDGHSMVRVSGAMGNTGQDAQKVRPARPQRVKDRGIPSGVR